MATSGTYSFSVTRDDIIREAMLNIGKLGEAETPTAQEVTDCSRKLNMLVKQWQGKQDFAPGLKMWTRRHGDLFLSNSTGQYNLGPSGDNWTTQSYQQQTTATANSAATSISVPNTNITVGDYVGIELDSGALYWTTVSTKVSTTGITIPSPGLTSIASSGAYVFNYTTKAQRPLEIEAVVLRDTNFQDIPIRIMTLQDYSFLPTKQSSTYTSDPTAIYYESQLTNGVLYVDVGGAGDVTKRLRIDYLESIQDFNAATDTPQFPQQWYAPLCWGLTQLIAPMFNVPFTEDMKGNFRDSLMMAREPDSEKTSLYFQPGNE